MEVNETRFMRLTASLPSSQLCNDHHCYHNNGTIIIVITWRRTRSLINWRLQLDLIHVNSDNNYQLQRTSASPSAGSEVVSVCMTLLTSSHPYPRLSTTIVDWAHSTHHHHCHINSTQSCTRGGHVCVSCYHASSAWPHDCERQGKHELELSSKQTACVCVSQSIVHLNSTQRRRIALERERHAWWRGGGGQHYAAHLHSTHTRQHHPINLTINSLIKGGG